MKEAQKPSEKEAKKIYDIEKTMALTVFKKYWPDAVIDFKEAEIIEAPIVEPEGPTEEELLAIKEAEIERVRKIAEKARLAEEEFKEAQAKYEAELKALDES